MGRRKQRKHHKLHSKKSTPHCPEDDSEDEQDFQTIHVSDTCSVSHSDDSDSSPSSLHSDSGSDKHTKAKNTASNHNNVSHCSSNDVEIPTPNRHSLDMAIEPGFEDEEKSTESNTEHKNEDIPAWRLRLNRISNKIFHCICPLARPCAALIRCDMQTFWNILPSIVVIKALWLSYLCMFFCDLAKVTRHIPTQVDYDLQRGNTHLFVREEYSFGLWAYSKTVHEDYTMDGFVENEVKRVETCELNMRDADKGSPDELFLVDKYFIFARAFAISTAVIGSISMIVLWLTSARVQRLNTAFTRKLIGSGLLLCCLFQSLVLLFLKSKICRDTEYGEDRHCRLEEGSGTIFGGCLFWLLTGIAMMKMSPPTDTTPVDGSEDDDDDDPSIHDLQIHQSEPA